jgi:ppGpp synthetase/RelA/SpoT-type nucleotidyltranferase
MAEDSRSLTTSQVNRAGRAIRRWTSGEDGDRDHYERAIGVVLRYRAAHQYPLAKATMGLRSVVSTVGLPIEVSQRLKRMPTIIDKLDREPTMQLANMQDIGGCRAVFDTLPGLRRAEQKLKKNRPPVRYSDYVVAPRASGYRAVHVVVGYLDRDGIVRHIEVQLRTKVMHEWAVTVERLSGSVGEDLKSRGPAQLRALLAAVSEAMAMEEAGETVTAATLDHLTALRHAAIPFLGRQSP